MAEVDADLGLLIDASKRAADIALGLWRGNPAVTTKPDGSPVSDADLAVDAALREALMSARPGYGWLSEESPDDPARLGARRCFVVDPIDGTRAFLAGEATWAHSLAVAEAGRVVAAVVYLPARGLLYTGSAGGGAWLGDSPLCVSRHGDPDGARTLASRPAYAAQHWQTSVPRFDRHFRASMAYRLAAVAEGRFDAMLTFAGAWEWDIAAGALLVAEAGGIVSDRHGAALRFNKAARRSEGVVAANPTLHSALIGRIAHAAAA